MNTNNKQMNRIIIASAVIAFNLSIASTASAGYVTNGSGGPVLDGSGNCVVALATTTFESCGDKKITAQPISKPAPPVVVVPPAPPVKVMVKAKPKPKPMAPKMITRTLSLNEAAGTTFGFDNSSLSSSAQQQLVSFANTVKSSNVTPSNVSVVGHTDSVGPESYNQKLSEKRANSVANFLESQGLNQTTMNVSGRGESQPVASNKTKAGRSKNRRVDIRVSGQRSITVKQ